MMTVFSSWERKMKEWTEALTWRRKVFFYAAEVLMICWFLTVVSGIGEAMAAMSDEEFLELCSYGTEAEIESAVKTGANVNAKDFLGWTPLMYAARNNPDPGLISTLIGHGADVDGRSGIGQTALMMASGFAGYETVSILIGAGADVIDREDDGWTALMWAANQNGDPRVTSLLIDRGSDVNARNDGGQTPLILAALLNKNPAVLSLLISSGADVRARDKDGKMAVDYASQNTFLADTAVYRQLKELSR
jgi:ankyrin repeat protein